MQIHAINNYNLKNKYGTVDNKNVSFEGFGSLKALMPKARTISSINKQEVLQDECSRFGSIIGVQTSDLINMTKNTTLTRFKFLKSLVTKYNARNFSLGANSKEDPQALIEAFKVVTDPHMAHFNIISKSDAPFSEIEPLLKAAKDKKSLEFVQKMQHEVLGGSKNSFKLMTDMLNSPNKSEYIKNPGAYSSYLKINQNNKDAIKELDELIKSGTYNQRAFDAKVVIADILKGENVRAAIGTQEKFLEQNYTKEGGEFLKSILFDFLAFKKNLSKEDYDEILKMYKTANVKNIQTRLDILKRFRVLKKNDNNDTPKSEIREMKKLFDRMDSDKSSANFVYKVLGDDIKVPTIRELNTILDVVPSKKAEIFHKNIARICRYTDEKERIAALKNEVENPFFITEYYAQLMDDSIKAGFSKKESKISRMARSLENKINKMRYNRISSAEGISGSGIYVPMPTNTTRTQITNIPSSTIQIEVPKIELKRTFKESPKARRLRVQNDVNEIIKQKLGAKTLEKQQGDYAIGAKVMRLKLLPEIFESIKDTRKMQRLSGKKLTVENRDALKLYSRINGKNRKLVNYMLKQTDSDGKRIYDIKDIICRLDLIEQKTFNLKAAKGKEFKAADAKRICDYEYETIINRYGKLKRAKKKKVA